MEFSIFKNTFIKNNYTFLYDIPDNIFDMLLYIMNIKYLQNDENMGESLVKNDDIINFIINILSYNDNTLLIDRDEFVKKFMYYFNFHPSLIYKINIPFNNIVSKYFISIYCANQYSIDIFLSSNVYEEFVSLEKLSTEFSKLKKDKKTKLENYIYENYVPFDQKFLKIYIHNKDYFYISKEYKSYIPKSIYISKFPEVYETKDLKKFYIYNIYGLDDKIYYKMFFEYPEIFEKYIQGKANIKEINISLIAEIAKNKSLFLEYKNIFQKLLTSKNNIGLFYNLWKKIKSNRNLFLIDVENVKKISINNFEDNFKYYYLIQNIRCIYSIINAD